MIQFLCIIREKWPSCWRQRSSMNQLPSQCHRVDGSDGKPRILRSCTQSILLVSMTGFQGQDFGNWPTCWRSSVGLSLLSSTFAMRWRPWKDAEKCVCWAFDSFVINSMTLSLCMRSELWSSCSRYSFCSAVQEFHYEFNGPSPAQRAWYMTHLLRRQSDDSSNCPIFWLPPLGSTKDMQYRVLASCSCLLE